MSQSALRARPTLFLLCGILLFSTVLYLPPFATHFVGDDYIQLQAVAEFVNRPLGAWEVLDPFWTTWYYRPLQNLWFLVGRLLFGFDPFGYYAVQVLWHALNISLLYRLTRDLGTNRMAALLGTALFAVHVQHHDVAGWISSIAILQVAAISTLAAICYLRYFRESARSVWIWLTVGLAVLALFVHEEGLLLVPFLVAVRLSFWQLRRPRREEWLALGVLVPLLLLYIGIQLVRPNLTIQISDAGPAAYAAALAPNQVAHFIVTSFGRWTTLNYTAFGVALLDSFATLPLLEIVFSVALLFLAWLWFRNGNRTVRLGLIWAGLHLAFLYLALWSQRPDLFGGRHVYVAWLGVCLAISGSAHQLLANRSSRWLRRVLVALVLLIGVVWTWQVWQIERTNRAWLAHVAEVAEVEAQMKRLFPQLEPEMRLFASRFVLVPGFMPAALSVWYEQPVVYGGSLEALRQYRSVTNDFYVLDYDKGELSIALPGLQETPRSELLWLRAPEARLLSDAGLTGAPDFQEAVVAGPEGAQRLAVQVELSPDAWSALGYPAEIDDENELRVALWGRPEAQVRIRVTDPDGDTAIVYTRTLGIGAEQTWQAINVSLEAFAGRAVVIWLEATGPEETAVYWSNPRLVPQN